MRDFLIDRIRLVNELIAGGPQVAYADLVLILTSVISGCAAARWPGSSIDRNRFVELLIKHSPAEFNCDHICTAALIRSNLVLETDTAWGELGQATRIFTDEEIDLDFAAAQQSYPNLALKQLKDHSFAALIYKWLRCAYAHEYSLDPSASHMPSSRDRARISYIGRLGKDGRIHRMTTFHLNYLIEMASYHAKAVPNSPQTKPPIWWLQQI